MSSLVPESQLEIQKLENADYLLLPEGRGAEHVQWSQSAWVQIPAEPLGSCVTWGKLLNLSVLWSSLW